LAGVALGAVRSLSYVEHSQTGQESQGQGAHRPTDPERDQLMQRSRCCWAALAATLAVSTLFLSTPTWAEDELYKPQVAGPSPEASQAAKSIRLAPGLKVELFAAEPLLAN